jgi:hypothetical protein
MKALPTQPCWECSQKINAGDDVIIDPSGLTFCSLEHLFKWCRLNMEYHGTAYRGTYDRYAFAILEGS